MALSYVPVMAAKKGEFKALDNTRATLKDRMIPVFELPAQKEGITLFEKPIARTAVSAGKSWGGRQAFLDISKWPSNAVTEGGVHIMEYAFSQFVKQGVMVSPVIGYDRWGDPRYQLALKNIRNTHQITPCIRFDKDTIRDDLMDGDYFIEQIGSLLVELNLTPQNCYVMLDFRDISTSAVPDIVNESEFAISLLRGIGFQNLIVCGGSMPATVNGAVEERDSEGCIARVEMLVWKTLLANKKNGAIIFGDYPIRNPDAADGIIALDANAKIRYTIGNQFFVIRGHTKREDSLTTQHKELAKKLVNSRHFFGPGASWGDAELQKCALGLLEIKEATSMIAIDTNCHITAIMSEIVEHQTSQLIGK